MRDSARQCRNPDSDGLTDARDLRTRRVSIIGLATLVGALEAQGLARNWLLRDTGIESSALDDPHATVTPPQEFALVRNLLQHLPVSAPGIYAGSHYHLSTLGLVGGAMATNPTGADAIRYFLRYADFSYTYFTLKYEQTRDGLSVCLGDRHDLGDLRRYFLDRDVTFVRIAARELLPNGGEHALDSVEFAYPEPPDTRPYEAAFSCPVSFGASITRVCFNQPVLLRPLPQANTLTLRILDEQCRHLALEYGIQATWSERVRTMLLSRPHEFTHIDIVAERLGCTSRTVARHLRQEGTRFQTLRDEARAIVAKHLLTYTDLTVEQISYQACYSEASAFIAAFRRWTGQSPAAFRAATRAGMPTPPAPYRCGVAYERYAQSHEGDRTRR